MPVMDKIRKAVVVAGPNGAGKTTFVHQNFVTEVTLSSSRLGRHLVAFREAGYEVEIVFIHLESAELCVARVAERVRKGGHSVTPPDVRRRYRRSVQNFWGRYRPLVDGWFLMQNSSQSFRLVAYGTSAS